MSIKFLIRRFVLTTSLIPIINHIYSLYYKLVIRLTVRLFKQYPNVKAVYLRRGCAKGEIIPLISDIDLSIIEEGLNDSDKKTLKDKYKKLKRLTTILENTIEIYSRDSIYKRYFSRQRCFRVVEGKETWKLLYGDDYLSVLPPIKSEDLLSGIFHETNFWWTIFLWRFLQVHKNLNDYIIQNSICYKVVGEILKMSLAFQNGILTFRRQLAFEKARNNLLKKERTLVEKLEISESRKFLNKDMTIVEETKNFLFTYLNRFCESIPNHTLSDYPKDIDPKVDYCVDECFHETDISTSIMNLVEYIKGKWQNTYLRTYLATSYYFNLDEQILLIEIDPERPPTMKELTDLYAICNKINPKERNRIYLYLLFPNCALRIDVEYERGWFSILCPSSNPDLFMLIKCSETILDGNKSRLFNFKGNPFFAKDFVLEMENNLYGKLQEGEIFNMNNFDFLQIFWKTIQIVLINASIKKGKILFPLTLPAIVRAASAEGITLPIHLEYLADAYKNELNGKICNISSLKHAAVNYLKEIRISTKNVIY